jgi:hypothetical protein
MRYVSTVAVVLLLLFAGCNTAGTGVTPTADGTGVADTGTETPDGVDASEVPGVEGNQLTDNTALLVVWYEAITTGHTDFHANVEGSSEYPSMFVVEQYSIRLRNDTDQQLYAMETPELNQSYYVDGDNVSVRDNDAGVVYYSNETNDFEDNLGMVSLYPPLSLTHLYLLEWEATDTTTVNGEQHYVFEATGVNETLWEQEHQGATNVDSVDGRMVVGSDGVFHTARVDISGSNAVNATYSLRTDDSIEVTPPDWYNASQRG